MTALIGERTLGTISRHITDLVVAYLVAVIAYGGLGGGVEFIALAQILLAIKLHLFVLPLAFTPVMGHIPPWGWYVIAVLWVARFVHHSGYSIEDIVAELEAAYLSLPEVPAQPDDTEVSDD